MNTTSLSKVACGLLAASMLLVVRSKADPIVFGDINFEAPAGGTVTGIGLVANGLQLKTATTILSVNAIVQAGSQGGDYLAVPDGTAVTFDTPLYFVALESAAPSTVTPWWTFTVGGLTYSFAIDGSVLVTSPRSKTNLDINGVGTASITGFSPSDKVDPETDVNFDISIGTSGASLTFGDSTSIPTSAVPDSGTTALLIGLGLVGVGIGAIAQRRRLAKSAA